MADYKQSCQVCISLCLILLNVEGRKCPSGFVSHGASCYWFSTLTGNFVSARTYCEHLESHLVIVTSKSEDDFLRGYAQQRGKAGFYFLGGSDIAVEGLWKWEGRKPMVYNNWSPGEPGNHDRPESCVALYRPLQYRWVDLGCNDVGNFICEFSA